MSAAFILGLTAFGAPEVAPLRTAKAGDRLSVAV